MKPEYQYDILLEAKHGHTARVIPMLTRHNMNSKDPDNNSIMHFAAKTGNLELAKYLILLRAEINCKNNDCDTPLHMAAQNGFAVIVKFFLNNGTLIDVKNKCKNTPLHEASTNGHAEVVKILLERNAKVDIKNNDEKTPQDCSKNGDVLVEFLNAKPTLFDLKNKEEFLFNSIKNKWMKLFNKLIDDKININAISDDEALDNPLIYAARYGQVEMLETLIQNAGDIFYKNKFGNAAIHEAAYLGQNECLKVLLKYGANVDEIGWKRRTPFLCAVLGSSNETMELIIKKKANILITDENLFNALHIACYRANSSTAELLLENGVKLEGRNEDGQTPLHFASRRGIGLNSMMQTLINKGADVNTSDNKLRTPLHTACINNHPTIVQLLLKNGANTNAVDVENKTALNLAEEENLKEIIYILKN